MSLSTVLSIPRHVFGDLLLIIGVFLSHCALQTSKLGAYLVDKEEFWHAVDREYKKACENVELPD